MRWCRTWRLPAAVTECITANVPWCSRFECHSTEQAFRAQLQPRVARRTILLHTLSLALRASACAWAVVFETLRPSQTFTWDRGDTRLCGILAALVVAGLEAAICTLLLLASCCRSASWSRWEVVSTSTTALMCAASAWSRSRPWSVLLGMHLGETEAGVARTEEIMSVFGMAAMSTGFFALVPVRLVAWPVAPACSLVSYLLLLAIAGPTDQDILLWSLGALVLAFCLPLGSFRDRELHERELWLAGKEPSEREMLADIVFTMSDRFTLTRTCAAVHDRFFGQNAEGLVFTTLLPRAERTRFIKTIDSVRSARRTDSATVTLFLPRGPLKVQLCVEQVVPPDESQAANSFRIGVRILDDVQSPMNAHSRQVSGGSHSVASVPEDMQVPHLHLSGMAFSEVMPGMRVASEGSIFGCLSVVPSDLWNSEVEATTLTWTHAAGTQTEGGHAEAAVNTSVVMQGSSFRCSTCCRPPRSPKRSATAVRRSLFTAHELIRYSGSEFDGFWGVVWPQHPPPNTWLRHLSIYAGHVLLGDNSEAQLMQAGELGPVLLCGGELRLLDDGRIERIGQSGSSVVFALEASVEDI